MPAPLGLARGGVDRLYEGMRRAGVERVADVDRGRLGVVFAFVLGRLGGHRQVAGALRPGELELPDILRRDVRQRGIAPPRGRAAIIAPVGVRRAGRCGGERRARCVLLCGSLRFDVLVAEHQPEPRQRDHARGHRRHRARARARPAPPTGQQHQREQYGRRDQPRDQLQPVEPDLPQRPQQRADPDRDIEPASGGVAAPEQSSARHHRDPGDEVIRRAADRHEHATRYREEPAEDRDDPCQRHGEQPSHLHASSMIQGKNAAAGGK